MKYTITLCLFFLSCFIHSNVRSQSFAKEYHLGTGTTWQVIKPTADGNLIAIGDYTESATSPNIIMITKMSPDGSVLWSRRYGGDIQQNGLNITETADSGFVVAGVEFVYNIFTSEFNATGCLIKFSKEGEKRWSRYITYGNREYFLLTHVAATPDGGVITGGNFEQLSGGTVGSYTYLAKVNAEGNIVWQKQFDTKGYSRWITEIFCNKQAVTVVSESSIGTGNKAKDAAAITILAESDGTVVASKQFRLSEASIHFIQAAGTTADGGIVVSGTSGRGIGEFDIWTFKVNSKLKLLWSNKVALGADDRPNKIYSGKDGNVVIGGISLGSDDFFRPYLLWLNGDNGAMVKNQWLDEVSRGVFGITSYGGKTYALASQQFGIGSNPYVAMYGWSGSDGICTQSTQSGEWQEAPDVETDNRKLPATDIEATVSDMDYKIADVTLTVNNLCSVLPLQLLSFRGRYENNQTIINWQTANETNTALFTVEKSADNGSHFINAGTVTAKGTGSNDYSFIDPSPLNGRTLYRLKMKDKDGRESYSNNIEVNAIVKAWALYPNPAKNEISIRITLPQAGALQLSVMNGMGQTVLTQPLSGSAGMLTKTLNVSKLAAGIYFIKISGAGVKETLRFEKQ